MGNNEQKNTEDFVPCSCPKGGRYEREDGSTYPCEKCGGSEWVKPQDRKEECNHRDDGLPNPTCLKCGEKLVKPHESGWEEVFAKAWFAGDFDGASNSIDLEKVKSFIRTVEQEAVERTVREIFNLVKKEYIEVSSPMSDSLIFNNGVGEALNVVESYAKEHGINLTNER